MFFISVKKVLLTSLMICVISLLVRTPEKYHNLSAIWLIHLKGKNLNCHLIRLSSPSSFLMYGFVIICNQSLKQVLSSESVTVIFPSLRSIFYLCVEELLSFINRTGGSRVPPAAAADNTVDVEDLEGLIFSWYLHPSLTITFLCPGSLVRLVFL